MLAGSCAKCVVQLGGNRFGALLGFQHEAQKRHTAGQRAADAARAPDAFAHAGAHGHAFGVPEGVQARWAGGHVGGGAGHVLDGLLDEGDAAGGEGGVEFLDAEEKAAG